MRYWTIYTPLEGPGAFVSIAAVDTAGTGSKLPGLYMYQWPAAQAGSVDRNPDYFFTAWDGPAPGQGKPSLAKKEEETIKALQLTKKRREQKQVIKASFRQLSKQGFVCSYGKRLDSSREDLDNLTQLLDYCKRKNITETELRLYDNAFLTVSLEQLQKIREELQEYCLAAYHRKWQKEVAIDKAETMAGIAAITWDSKE